MNNKKEISDGLIEVLKKYFPHMSLDTEKEFRELIDSGSNVMYAQGYQDGVADCNKVVNKVRLYGNS